MNGSKWSAMVLLAALTLLAIVFVHSPEPLHPGQLLSVKVTDYQAYDLVAEVPRTKARTLNVLAAR